MITAHIWALEPSTRQRPDAKYTLYYDKVTNDIEDDAAYFHPCAYRMITGTLQRKTSRSRKNLTIVKIVYDGGRPIYRRFMARSGPNFGKGAIALPYTSLRLLTDEDAKNLLGREAAVSCSWWHSFYWHHPFHATRTAYRLGLLSAALGVLSLVCASIG